MAAVPPLAFAPADSAYAFASEGVPSDIADAWIARDERLPALYLPILQSLLETPVGQAPNELADKRTRGLIKALQAEIKDRDLSELMQRWGLSRTPRVAIFALGLQPVARIELAYPARFERSLKALLRRAGWSDAQAEVDGLRYWRLSRTAETSALVLGLHEGHLVLSLTRAEGPAPAPELRAVFGLERPARSLLDSGAVTALNARLGFGPYGSGFVDSRRLLAQIVTAQTTAATAPEQTSETKECRERSEALLADWPQLSIGYGELGGDGYRLRYVFETSPELLPRLSTLQGPAPALDAAADAPLQLSIGLQPLALRALLSEPGPQLRGSCLGELQLAMALGRLSSALNAPALIEASNALSGLRLRLDDLRLPNDALGPHVQGSLIALGRSPKALVSALKDPPQDLPLPAIGAAASALPATNGQPAWLKLFLARSDSAIGVAVSEAAAAALPAELGASADTDLALIDIRLAGPFWANLLRGLPNENAEAAAMFGPSLHALEQARSTRLRLMATEFGLELETEVRYR